MSEQKYQTKIIKHLEANGYYTIKTIRTNKAGTPDIIAIKNGRVLCIEVKTKRGVVSRLQEYRLEEIRSYGARAFVMREGVDPLDKIE